MASQPWKTACFWGATLNYPDGQCIARQDGSNVPTTMKVLTPVATASTQLQLHDKTVLPYFDCNVTNAAGSPAKQGRKHSEPYATQCAWASIDGVAQCMSCDVRNKVCPYLSQCCTSEVALQEQIGLSESNSASILS